MSDLNLKSMTEPELQQFFIITLVIFVLLQCLQSPFQNLINQM